MGKMKVIKCSRTYFVNVIIILFIVSVVTPMTIREETISINKELANENDVFVSYNEYVSSKSSFYREKPIRPDLKEGCKSEEIVKIVEMPISESFNGLINSPWPMKCHDLRHTARSLYSTADNPPGVEKWRFQCEWIESSITIADNGIIYFGDFGYYIYAVNPDGTLKWRYKTDGRIYSTPAIDEEGVIYAGSFDDHMYAIYSNGSLKWKFTAYHSSIVSSPAIAENGTIYFGGMGPDENGRIYAINPDGTEKWHYDTGYWITSDPAIGNDGTVYIGSGDNYLYAMYPNGTLCWRFQTGHYVKGPPSIADDGTIYIGSWDDYLYALYSNGTMKWRYKVGAGTETNPSIANDGTIYVGGAKLWAINPNGTMKWEFELGPERHIHRSSPAISADGIIYVGVNIGDGNGGEIISVNSDGTERWRKKIANWWIESSPSIAEDGTVYIGTTESMNIGYLCAFGRGALIIDIDGPYNADINEEIQFTSTVSGGIPPYNYSWDFGVGNESYKQNPTYAYSTADTYTITLTVTDDEGNISSDTTTATITERDTNLEIDININGVTIENIGDVDAYNVEWNLNITGGIFGFIDEHLYDTKDSLPKGDKITVPLPRLIGLGQLKIAATAEADNAEKITKEADGFILLFFVIVK